MYVFFSTIFRTYFMRVFQHFFFSLLFLLLLVQMVEMHHSTQRIKNKNIGKQMNMHSYTYCTQFQMKRKRNLTRSLLLFCCYFPLSSNKARLVFFSLSIEVYAHTHIYILHDFFHHVSHTHTITTLLENNF